MAATNQGSGKKAAPKKELAVFTQRNILKEINNTTDPVKKAALRKERAGKLAAMKSVGDTRAAAWSADKEMMPASGTAKAPAKKAPFNAPKITKTAIQSITQPQVLQKLYAREKAASMSPRISKPTTQMGIIKSALESVKKPAKKSKK